MVPLYIEHAGLTFNPARDRQTPLASLGHHLKYVLVLSAHRICNMFSAGHRKNIYSLPSILDHVFVVMLLLITAVFLFKRYGTHAVPLPTHFSTSPVFDAPVFARDDSSSGCTTRTVLDILWSCLATTFACTWLSVHPNVPWRNEGKWTLLGRRIFLMFFSILAPEFMIMWAFKQWRGAVLIRETVNKSISGMWPG